jgi:hypothetical protein
VFDEHLAGAPIRMGAKGRSGLTRRRRLRATNWGKNVTLLSCIGKRGGMGASLVVEGSTNTRVFETYLTEVLCAPRWRKGGWW